MRIPNLLFPFVMVLLLALLFVTMPSIWSAWRTESEMHAIVASILAPSAQGGGNASADRLPANARLQRLRGLELVRYQRPEEALPILEQALLLQPGDRRTMRLLAITSDMLGNFGQADQFSLQAGENAAWMVDRGNDFWQQNAYGEALLWYRRSTLIDPALIPALSFRIAIAQLMQTDLHSPADLDGNALAQFVNATVGYADSALVAGGNFRWLTRFPEFGIEAGMPLSFPPDSPLGTIWWNGEAAAIVELQASGQHTLTFEFLSSAPPPIEIALKIDGELFEKIALLEGDMSPQTVVISTELPQGAHVFSVRLLNDAVTGGSDRNAIIRSLRIQTPPRTNSN